MTQGLWLKRVWSGRSKGISTVLGTVFLTLVIFAISTNVFLWTMSKNAQYTQAVKDENQKDIDRLSEHVIASGANYSVSGDEVAVTATVRNAGSVAVQIINLWVFDTDPSNQRYTNKSLDLNLNPGEAWPLSSTVTMPGADHNHTFVSWFVTARGNTVPLQAEQDIVIAHVAQGIGSLALNFNVFRYFFYNDSIPQKLVDYPSGTSSFNVPRTPEIAFGITLRNLDPLGRAIVLNQYSQAWLYFPKSPGQSLVWHIVNVTPNGTIVTPYSEISLRFGESKMFVFASEDPGAFSKVSIPAAVRNLPCALNLLLLGTIASQDYGQNIPFVSIYVTD